MEQVLNVVQPYLPYVAYALPFVFGLVALAVSGRLNKFAQETVSAVYRVAIHVASELQDEGLAWLRSEAGVAYRKELASRAYDAVPATVYGVPVGLVKLVVSREVFCAMVERAFNEMAELAERLELPEELPGHVVLEN